MKKELSSQQVNDILHELDQSLKEGPWESSNFLKAIGKNLHDIRDEFAKKAQDENPQAPIHPMHAQKQQAEHQGKKEVYVGLYSSDGSNIHSWERILSNLPRQVVSRPIYDIEEDMKAILRSKENKLNEAYAAIYVDPDDIIPIGADKAPVDKLGKSLLTLKDKSVILENIHYFVNQAGMFHYSHGQLTKFS